MRRSLAQAFCRPAVALGLALGLTGCSLAGYVGSDVSQYQEASGKSSDRQVFLNILSARDREPIHFEQLTQVHGSVTATGTVAFTFPFGANSAAAKGNAAAPGATFSQNPSFDIGTLDDQSFWRGIATQPISPEAIQGLIRSGVLNAAMAFLLFFSEIDVGSTPIDFEPAYENESRLYVDPRKYIINSPQEITSDDVYKYSGLLRRDTVDRAWWGYLSYINHTVGAPHARFFVHSFQELSPLGPRVPVKGNQALKDLSSIDTSKVVVEAIPGRPTAYQTYAPSQRFALCLYSGGTVHLLRFPSNSVPTNIYDIPPNEICSRQVVHLASQKAIYQVYTIFRVRSVYAILQYLGDVLRWQDLNPGQCISASYPVVRVPGQVPEVPCAGSVLFRVFTQNPLSPYVSGRQFVPVVHDGIQYYLGQSGKGCTSEAVPAYCDFSLDVLSVIQVLLNLNKSAAAIPTTPTVRTVP